MYFFVYHLCKKSEYGLRQIMELLRERVETLPAFIKEVRTRTPSVNNMAFVFLFYSIHNPGIEPGLSGFFGRTPITKKLSLRVTDQKRISQP
jgi:hypothetical protein